MTEHSPEQESSLAALIAAELRRHGITHIVGPGRGDAFICICGIRVPHVSDRIFMVGMTDDLYTHIGEVIERELLAELGNEISAWASENEIAEPPLDWVRLGDILRLFRGEQETFSGVDQTIFWDPSEPNRRGNCHQAVVASLCGLPLESVPHFVQDEVDNPDGPEFHWWARTSRWLAASGFQMVYLAPVSTPGADLASCQVPRPLPGEPYAVVGVSPRDPSINHVVIYRDGEMVHDPHPDKTGLAKITDTYHWTVRHAEPLLRDGKP